MENKEIKIKQSGFTLIELLVVIAIVGLLSSLLIVSLNSARVKSRDAKRLSDIKQLASALELYYNQNFAYPVTYASLAPSYMASLPTYPTPVDANCNATNLNSTYAYTSAGNSTYQIRFCISGNTGSITTPGTHTLSHQGIQ